MNRNVNSSDVMAPESGSWQPGRIFYFGLAAVLLAPWIPFIPAWYTFIHMWRVDLAASIFLLSTLSYLVIRFRAHPLPISLSTSELILVVYPLLAFITWSALSIAWSPSWKSAVHHTLIWSEYLTFYLLARYLVDQGRNFSKLLTTAVLVLVLFAIPALIEFSGSAFIGGESSFRARFAKYGEQIVTILPLLLVFIFRSSGRALYAGLAALAALWLLVYCTAGRINIVLFAGVFLAMAGVVLVVPKLRRYRLRLALSILVLIAAPIPFYVLTLAAGAPDVPIASRMADTSGNSYSTGFRMLMNNVSLEMFLSNPIVGVGADNYGLQFNDYRRRYAAANPADPNLVYGEIGIVGHAHNEFLQIAAELGSVGVLVFLWFIAGIGYLTWLAIVALRRGSLIPLAALLGLGAFLVSSAVSAYSFRLLQNGFLFFIVLAVATKSLVPRSARSEPASTSALWFRPAVAIAMLVCISLAAYSLIRVTSVVLTAKANRIENLSEAEALYRVAMQLDDENPDVRNNLGMRYFYEERYVDAIPLISESIRIGRAESTDFSYLASCFSLTGDASGAQRTISEAVSLYPRSPFLLSRYAALLEKNGDDRSARLYIDRAFAADTAAANTWMMMLRKGSQAASDQAVRSRDYKPIMDLQPTASIYAVLDERHALYPEERPLFAR